MTKWCAWTDLEAGNFIKCPRPIGEDGKFCALHSARVPLWPANDSQQLDLIKTTEGVYGPQEVVDGGSQAQAQEQSQHALGDAP